jgi:predicted nucleotidyltransferase
MKKLDEEKIKEIAEKYGLRLLLLFGSQVTGKTHPKSDFDFGFISKEEFGYARKCDLMHDLAMLVEFPDVEDVDLKKAGPLLLKEIVKSNKIIFEEVGAYQEFFLKAVHSYFEAKPIFKLQETMYLNTINKYRKEYAK